MQTWSQEQSIHDSNMAPVGKMMLNGKGLHSKDDISRSKAKDDDLKEELSVDDSFHSVYIKVEEEEEDDDDKTDLYVAMNVDEGVVIKSEENSEEYVTDFEQKSEVDSLGDVICKPEKDDENEKSSSQSSSDSTEDTGRSLLCKVCGKQFTRAFYFNLHVKTHDISASNNQNSNKPHKCQECGKTFALLQHLAGHSRTHIVERYFECPVCRRKFTELSNLTMHLLKTHPDEKPYKCSECEKQFTQASALKKHMRTHSSITSQDIDRIDMLFYVGNEAEKDLDEPMRKRIKLEKEDKVSPLKVTPHLSKEKSFSPKGEREKSASSKGRSPPLKEKSTSPKGKLVGKEKVSQPKELSPTMWDLPVQVKVEPDENDGAEFNEDITSVKEVISSQSKKSAHFDTKSSPLTKEVSHITKDISYEDQAFAVSPKVLSQSFGTTRDTSLSVTSRDKLSPLECLAQIPADKESSLPLRNGVQLENGPSVKVMKFAKLQQESEPLSVKVNDSQTSPFKAFSGSNENNLEPQVTIKEETENISTVCNGDRGQKGRSATFLSLDRNRSGWLTGRDNKKSEKRDPSPTVEKPDGDCEVRFKCHRCEIFFSSEEKLYEHLMDHTGVKLIECRFCGKDFTKMTSLKRHLYYHVVGNIPQDCTRCGESFSSFKDLKDHCVTNMCDASARSKFKCFRCRKQTSSLKMLKVHLLSQCNEDPIKYYIPQKNGNNLPEKNGDSTSLTDANSDENGSGFFNLTSKWVTQKVEKTDFFSNPDMQGLNFDPDDVETLQILKEVDPSDKEGECWNLQCEECGERFVNGEEAKAHFNNEVSCKSKSEEIPEKETLKIKVVFEEDEDLKCSLNCSECDKKIIGVEKMLLHIKEHIYERNTLTCPVLKCGKLFKDPKDFKLHLRAHTGHKPFKCADCGKRFFLRENYENHAQRHGILKNWSSLNTIIGESSKANKTACARSPITIESTIANLEVSESDVDRKFRWTPHATTQPISDRVKFKPLKNLKVEKTAHVTKTHITSGNKPKLPPLRPAPSVSKPVLPVNKSVPAVNKSVPAVSKPVPAVSKPIPAVSKTVPAVIRPAPSVNKPGPAVIRAVPAFSRTVPALIRPAPSTNKSSPSVNRPAHTGGFLSLTASFPVGAPRSFTITPPGNNKPVFSVANVTSSKLGLTQKDPNTRVHPASYYRVSDHSRAHIQAANAELRKYPRSGRCEVCKKICSRLDKHMMVHLNQKPHLCPVCPQAFRQSEHLRRHIRARHEGNHRQFECPNCHKKLTRKDKLKEHMKNCCRSGGRIIDLHATSSVDSHDGPVTLGDSLFDMIPGPHGIPLEGHRVE